MAQSACCILVVDDDLDLRLALTDALTDEGFSVLCAAHGQEALRVLRSSDSPVHVVLLDLMMPVMNGWQFRREQQQDLTLADIPVLVLSAGSRIAEAASSMGAAGYFRKPIDLAELLDTVDRVRKT